MGTVSVSFPELGAVYVSGQCLLPRASLGTAPSSPGACTCADRAPHAAPSCPGNAGSPLGSAQRRSKKQRAGGETEASEPSHPPPAGLARAVVLRAPDRDQHAVISGGGLALASSRGYRSVQATHGVHAGAWYFEVHVRHLGPSGAARVGWATAAAEQQGPVGGDRFGYAYRSLEGIKVHKGVREPYGAGWEEGDVIGCLISLPRPEPQPAQGTPRAKEGRVEGERFSRGRKGPRGKASAARACGVPSPVFPVVMDCCAQRGDDKTFLVLSVHASGRRHD